MQIFKIKKKSGKYRTIYAPDEKEKKELKTILTNDIYNLEIDCKYAHGFMPLKNIVTNAEQHIGFNVTISLDLKDFFDTVTIDKASKLQQNIKDKCFVDGAAKQGLPTSPMIANIIFKPVDDAIIKLLNKIGERYSYTRYADDLTFSFDNEDSTFIDSIITKVSGIINRSGFKVNKEKTHVQYAYRGKRRICGVFVDDKEVLIGRKTKRKIRQLDYFSGIFEKNLLLKNKVEGLKEFAKLKKPNPDKNYNIQLKNATDLATKYNLSLPYKTEKYFKDRILKDNVIITNNPMYFIGMSTFRDSWTTSSCMRLNEDNDLSYRKGCAFWQRCTHVSLVIELSDKIIHFDKYSMRGMRKRCLIYNLVDGTNVYGTIYGNSINNADFIKILENNGFKQYGGNYFTSNLSGIVPKDTECNLPSFDNGYYDYTSKTLKIRHL